MKKALRNFTIFAIALYFSALIINNVIFAKGYQTLLEAALLLTVGDFLIKPLIKFLLLPINILTLGLFRFTAGLLTIWLLTSAIGDIQFAVFNFHRTVVFSQTIPPFHLNGIWSLLPFSVIIWIISNIFSWLLK